LGIQETKHLRGGKGTNKANENAISQGGKRRTKDKEGGQQEKREVFATKEKNLILKNNPDDLEDTRILFRGRSFYEGGPFCQGQFVIKSLLSVEKTRMGTEVKMRLTLRRK